MTDSETIARLTGPIARPLPRQAPPPPPDAPRVTGWSFNLPRKWYALPAGLVAGLALALAVWG